ncbi:MAG: hypothetical protein HYZ54_12935 [Ignavibacteriae bacterium]|nr:hypothetical protein [Ignavibacteriota bacterium]
MAASTVEAKIRKATMTLGVANFLAGIAFLVGYFIAKEMLFLIAAGAMFVAFTGIILFSRKMKKKFSEMESSKKHS